MSNLQIKYALVTDRRKTINAIIIMSVVCLPLTLYLTYDSWYDPDESGDFAQALGYTIIITGALLLLLRRLKCPQTLLVTNFGLIYNGQLIAQHELVSIKALELSIENHREKVLGLIFTPAYLQKLPRWKRLAYSAHYKICKYHIVLTNLVSQPVNTVQAKLAQNLRGNTYEL
jgi:hypothetical protein